MNTRPFVRLAAHWETKEEKTLCDLNANIHGIRSKLKPARTGLSKTQPR